MSNHTLSAIYCFIFGMVFLILSVQFPQADEFLFLAGVMFGFMATRIYKIMTY